MVLPSRKES